MKLKNQEIVDNFTFCEIKFPAVLVDQTNYRISEIIKRNKAGEQVLGNMNLQYDFTNQDKNPNFDYINPFNDPGFDLDDLIRVARQNGQQITDLQNRYGEIQQSLDKAKEVEEQKPTPAPAPAPAPAPSAKDEPKG